MSGVNKPLPKRTHNINSLLEHTETRIKECSERLKIFNNIKIKLSDLKFVEGDIVLTRGGEKAIVCGIHIGDENVAITIDDTLQDKLFVVLATQTGYRSVVFDEIIPYNDATKVLYEK